MSHLAPPVPRGKPQIKFSHVQGVKLTHVSDTWKKNTKEKSKYRKQEKMDIVIVESWNSQELLKSW